ncbi:MAG: 2'-5' RNA ligase family protein [Frankiaceae bacterium]
MARIGIAIVIPDPHAEQLRRWRASFEDVGSHPVPPHVTLLAPTEVPDQVLPAMDRHLESVARKVGPFPMRLSGSSTFRPVSPVVFVNVVVGADHCARLESLVRSGPLAEPRPFTYHPHVTVAHDVADDRLDAAACLLAVYEAEFLVQSFTVFDGVGDGWRLRHRLTLRGEGR